MELRKNPKKIFRGTTYNHNFKTHRPSTDTKLFCQLDISALDFCIYGQVESKNKEFIRILVVKNDPIDINIQNDRLRCLNKNRTCVKCGMVGTIFLVQRKGNSYSLHLYGIKNNCLVEMTLDHIIPVSMGGAKNNYDNHQTMCYTCNHNKGNEFSINDIEKGVTLNRNLNHQFMVVVYKKYMAVIKENFSVQSYKQYFLYLKKNGFKDEKHSNQFILEQVNQSW